PLVRAEIWGCLERLKQNGLSILLIDKHVEAVTRLADHHYVLEKGRVVWDGTSAELRARPDVQHRYLGVRSNADGRPVSDHRHPERPRRSRTRTQSGDDDGSRHQYL